jgi:hypothetical protein
MLILGRLSIIPLLRPLVWQGPLIPVLPETLYEYLQAPDILFQIHSHIFLNNFHFHSLLVF